jgi:Tol biopolymer transport system component
MSIAYRWPVSSVLIAALGLALVSCDKPLSPTQPSLPDPEPAPKPTPAPPSGPCGPVAFVSDRDGRKAVYSATADCVITRLADGEAPAWSPVTRLIAFQTTAGPWEIHVMNLDGSGRRRLTSGRSPTWSPDGRQVAFEVWPYEGIHVIDADGSNRRRLYAHESGAYGPAWSPYGQQIAFSVGDPGDPPVRLFRMNADGSGATPLGGVEGLLPAWSPDGSQIAFVDQFRGVGVVQRDGFGRRLVVEGGYDPDWTADGRLVVTMGGRITRLWVNEPSGLRQLIPNLAVLGYSDGEAAWLR